MCMEKCISKCSSIHCVLIMLYAKHYAKILLLPCEESSTKPPTVISKKRKCWFSFFEQCTLPGLSAVTQKYVQLLLNSFKCHYLNFTNYERDSAVFNMLLKEPMGLLAEGDKLKSSDSSLLLLGFWSALSLQHVVGDMKERAATALGHRKAKCKSLLERYIWE